MVMQTDPIDDILAGKQLAIARMISRAERNDAGFREQLAALYAFTGKAHIVGVTGSPGSGKSSLVRALAQAARSQTAKINHSKDTHQKIGIVAIDPSSPFSGGAIMGDRIRMNDIANDEGVFIRSMATRGALGGLARAALDAVDVLDAAGYDLIFIETVGVGQDEVDIARAAHSVIVVSAPGMGDDVQTIKAGILEIADIHVVSKCDRPDANKTINELKSMLLLAMPDHSKWQPPVMPTSAQSGDGIHALLGQIDAHRKWLNETGEMTNRQTQIAESRILKRAEEMLRSRFTLNRNGFAATLIEKVAKRQMDPYAAAIKFFDEGEV
jgi:LAO/AO transport system kinase